MNKKLYFVLAVLIVAGLACSLTGTQPVSQPSNPIQATAVPTEEAPIVSSAPNLELLAYLADTQDIGNGMKRVQIMFWGKNASSGWWSYGLSQGFGGRCDNGQIIPILETEEGFTYKPSALYDYSCGGLIVDVPPGMTFGDLVVDEYIADSPFGQVFFDIPTAATPKAVTFGYGYNGWVSITEPYDQQVTTAKVLPGDNFEPINDPFDPAYKKYFHIYKPGEEIAIGTLAKIVVESAGTEADGSLSITINLISIDQGYKLICDRDTSAALLFQDGTVGYWNRLADCRGGSVWGPLAPELGPLQTTAFQYTAQNPEKLKVWLLGAFVLQEVSDAKTEARQNFIVELP